jgi:hypothetical protein
VEQALRKIGAGRFNFHSPAQVESGICNGVNDGDWLVDGFVQRGLERLRVGNPALSLLGG